MNDDQVMHAMSFDDAYHVERVLARGVGGVTELVSLGGAGPFVRKRIPSAEARRGVWATLPEIGCLRLPHIEASYETPDDFVVVYDYVPGETLEQVVDSTGRIDQEKAVQVIGQVCEAVGALHAHDIVHRDISPSNVILAADGAHLIDFGIAKLGVEGTGRDTKQLGTWGFAAPEQFGFAQTDSRSDIYSIGKLLGYLLTGVHPDSQLDFDRALDDETVVPRHLRDAVVRATQFEPSARFQSVGELARALSNTPATTSAPTTATTGTTAAPANGVPTSEPPSPVEKRGHGWAKIAVLVALAIALGLTVWTALSPRLGGASDSPAPVSDSAGKDESKSSSTRTTPDPAPSSGTATPTADPATSELKVVESYWSTGPTGIISAVVGLRNDSSRSIRFPTVVATGYDAAGKVTFSKDMVRSIIAPGQTIYYARTLDRSNGTSRVEFVPAELRSLQKRFAGTPPLFTATEINVSPDGGGGLKVTGMVEMQEDGEMYSSDYGLSLCAVFRNSSGEIVGGDSGSLRSHPEPGQAMPFDITIFSTPDYASCEVYVLPR